jgi:hypothetical protein
MKEIFERLNALKRAETKDTPDEVMVSAGLELLEQFLGDVHRVANSLEKLEELYRAHVGASKGWRA